MWSFAASTRWTALLPHGKPEGASPKSTVESSSQPGPAQGSAVGCASELASEWQCGHLRPVTCGPLALVRFHVSPWYVTKSRATAAPQPAGRKTRAAASWTLRTASVFFLFSFKANFFAIKTASSSSSELLEEEPSRSESESPSEYFPQSSIKAFPCNSESLSASSPDRRCNPSSFCVITCCTNRRPSTSRARAATARCVSVGFASVCVRHRSVDHGCSSAPRARSFAALVQMPSGPR
mmetsp:Transcript_27622/g.92785  ORF Transcript_27622/g.92785 Transcript_27622/m.92785 type:complete len:238 (+) Transcript_27622:411-1124(+)